VWSLGVLLFAMITSLYPDSSDINLIDADIWFQPGFSDGENFITKKKDNETLKHAKQRKQIRSYE